MAHTPVLYDESLRGLAINPHGVYVDCTFGRGGHSKGILQRLGEQGKLLALDRDRTAIDSEQALTMAKDTRFSLHHGCFSQLAEVISQRGELGKIAGVLMDFGVSSPQLDDAQRGFSFMRDGYLDMRMDKSQGLSAAQWLLQVDEPALVKVLFEYGEERFARRIARAIIARRAQAPLQTTRELALLIEQAVPQRESNKHPATRSFQAIRIKLNNELEAIKQVLQQTLAILAPGGRLVAISFHSLEDRIVKRFIRNESGPKFNPAKLPLKEADIERGGLIKIGKAITAGATEVLQNPRARSAIMRVAQRV